MIRLPIFAGKFLDVNLVAGFHLFVMTKLEFSMKNPKDLIKFYLENKIKKVKLFMILGFGFEIINFFSKEEYNAVMKVLNNASQYARATKELYE